MEQARDEFDTADILLSNGKYQAACYHSQQCAEKTLKALLLEKASAVPRSHDIVELRTRVMALGWTIALEIDEAVFLNSIYRGRYPTEEGLLPQGEPSQADAQRAHVAARTLVESAEAALAEAEANHAPGAARPVEPDNNG
jgi:HEPN domain-containing protein